MIHCGTNDVVGDGSTYDSIGRMQVATKPGKIKATIKGTTIFSDAGTVEVSAGTCSLKFTRTGTVSTLSTTACRFEAKSMLGRILAATRQNNGDVPDGI